MHALTAWLYIIITFFTCLVRSFCKQFVAQSFFDYTWSGLHIEWPIDNTPGKINWCQTWPGSTQGAQFSQCALCIQRYVQGYQSSADIFTHIILEKLWEPLGDCVIMGFVSNRTALFLSLLFIPTLGVHHIHAIGAFANIFLQFRGCVLYSRAT